MRMTVKLPKSLVFNAAKRARAIENGLEGAAKDVKVDFGVTTQTWTVKPAFEVERKMGERIVSTTDEIYGWVNDGTEPHTIVAHGPGGLAFGAPSSPKTSVRVIGSRAGSRGATMVHARVVHHPGSDARAFDEAIAKKWSGGLLASVLQRAIDSEL